MPALLRVLLALVLAAGVACATAATVLACTCAVQSEKQAFASADVVLVGVIVGRHDPTFGAPVISTGDAIVYTVWVEDVLKGEAEDRVEVSSARTSASCGLEMSEGQRWRLYAHRDGGLHVGACSRNELLGSDVATPDSVAAGWSAPAVGLLVLLQMACGVIVAALALTAARLMSRV